ncbi:GspH/FimT family pseudopilin [Thiovibrio frasassiensis]|uniref:Type II secretion system protein H n=1 Tax=Thiovibrio frasassiensis TaxID=2984131 RepID=A0A9X4MN59_9BACT|nr:GspH/FimT family pseudopilin [Thiovibrio frasassiensis]MDG4475727.1 GspH/FimT family pseudopilin [Thiovibrio frasassiensis]
MVVDNTMNSLKRQHRRAGFTLAELMMVIAIIGIMSMIAITMGLRYYPDYQARGAARNLVANLQLARIEAIRSSANVVVEMTPGVLTVTGRVGGYRAFVDDGAGGGVSANNIRDGAERIIYTEIMPDRVSLIGLAGFTAAADPLAAAGTRFTRYNARGILPSVADAGTITLGNGTRTYTAALSTAGYIRLGVF